MYGLELLGAKDAQGEPHTLEKLVATCKPINLKKIACHVTCLRHHYRSNPFRLMHLIYVQLFFITKTKTIFILKPFSCIVEIVLVIKSQLIHVTTVPLNCKPNNY